jgi:moderate conductance mechanosensitive channel
MSSPWSWSSIVALAEEAPPEITTEDVFGGDVDRPLTEWVEEHVTDNELVLWAINNALEPALQILIIVVLAIGMLWFIRRTIRRASTRVKEPDTGRGRRRDRRRGYDEGRSRPSVRRAQRADALGALANSIAGVVVWVVALFMVLGTFGISLGPLIAGAGIVGLALGFGAQGLVRDFISGSFMLIEDQYGVGDFIDAGEMMGVVEGITLRSTRIRDLNGTLWHVPNGEILRVGNMSQEWSRAVLDVAVSYNTDVDAASDIIQRVASAMAHEPEYEEQFLDEPEIWGVQDLGADSVDIRLVIKTQPGVHVKLLREIRRRIKAAFDAAGIEIPFSQRTVWLRTEHPVALGDQRTTLWSDPVLDERARQAAVEASVRGKEGPARGRGERMPEQEEIAEEVLDIDLGDGQPR